MAVFMTGGGKAPIVGKKASDFAVGESVFLNENGTPVEYLVVNQGIPSDSSLYDSSCDGLWLLRKDISFSHKWDSINNDYENSDIHAYLNADFLALFDADTQAAIQQVKIPYQKGTGSGGSIASGSSGLSTRIFLLSGYELGYTTTNDSKLAVDGARLDYFTAGTGTTARNLRIAYKNGSTIDWWTRSPGTSAVSNAFEVGTSGYISGQTVDSSYGIRPALILPSNAVFDKEALLFKGVA